MQFLQATKYNTDVRPIIQHAYCLIYERLLQDAITIEKHHVPKIRIKANQQFKPFLSPTRRVHGVRGIDLYNGYAE